jgi:putative endonuclease
VLTRGELARLGEDLAASHVARLGYRILARNFRIPRGELDLIAQDGPELVFIEVKTRIGGAELRPEEAVNLAKVARLTRLAEIYLQRFGHDDAMWRIDVVAVVLNSTGGVIRVEHLRNAVY